VETLIIRTRERSDFVEITSQVEQLISQSGIRRGAVHIFVPHTTAGVTLNENADPSVVRDVLADLERLVPKTQPYYTHFEGNSAAHFKASVVGSNVTVLIENGSLVLGTWQGIYLCEFDGPRSRKVHLQWMDSGNTNQAHTKS
jgi:secondary thiamine-phosphate synthase enzyme